MSEPKKIPSGKFLLDTGLLFEINRAVLHPLGLALEVSIEADDSVRVGDLWDYRDDPEGMLYGRESFEGGRAKYERFMLEFGNAKLTQRKDTLGFIVQTRPDQ